VHYLQSNQVSYAGKIVLCLKFNQFVYLPIRIVTILRNYHVSMLTSQQEILSLIRVPIGICQNKKMFSTLVKHKAMFANGVISSFEDYDNNQVGFFHIFQFYYIFTKFNWYVCCVGLSLGTPLVCSSVSPSHLQSS
jgi:hypothetical protein